MSLAKTDPHWLANQKKTEIFPEISLICRFLSAPIGSKPNLNLDTFFSPPEEQPMEFTNQNDLVKYVMQIKSELDSMKPELNSLKLKVRENKDQYDILKTENVQLKTELRSCIATIRQFKQNELIHESNNSDMTDSNVESIDGAVSDEDSVISVSPIAKKKRNLRNKIHFAQPLHILAPLLVMSTQISLNKI